MVNQCEALSFYSFNLFRSHGFDPLSMLLWTFYATMHV